MGNREHGHLTVDIYNSEETITDSVSQILNLSTN